MSDEAIPTYIISYEVASVALLPRNDVKSPFCITLRMMIVRGER